MIWVFAIIIIAVLLLAIAVAVFELDLGAALVAAAASIVVLGLLAAAYLVGGAPLVRHPIDTLRLQSGLATQIAVGLGLLAAGVYACRRRMRARRAGKTDKTGGTP